MKRVRHGSRRSGWLRGALVGAAATGVLSWLESLERRALGRPPVFDTRAIGRRLAARAGHPLTDPDAARLGAALRWLYGPLLGAAFVQARRAFPRSRAGAGLLLGGAVLLLELPGLSLAGATPPASRWPAPDLAALTFHTAAFGITAGLLAPVPRSRAG